MLTVYQAENIIDAHLVKNALESEGIPAYVSGEYLIGAIGELPVTGFIAVMVAQRDLTQASGIARRIDDELRQCRTGSGMSDDWVTSGV